MKGDVALTDNTDIFATAVLGFRALGHMTWALYNFW
jgi:hypothetical protein